MDERLRLAMVASFLSRGWGAALSLFAVPLYVRHLGMESYGVVGVFTSLAAIISFLDLGLGATLTREMSKVQAGNAPSNEARDTARTFEIAYAVLALLVGSVGALIAYPLGTNWITVETLAQEGVVHALMLASAALACQWLGNLYSSGLAGLQRQVQLGVVTTILSTVRFGASLATVWWYPTLEAFFAAQILLSFLQTLLLRIMFWSSLERCIEKPKFRWKLIRNTLHFAGGMTLITLTSIVQTQADKLVLSKALSLADFGIYSMISVLAAGLYMVVSPIFSVMFPRFSLLQLQKRQSELVAIYQLSSQFLAALVIPAAMLFTVFSYEILYIWTGDRVLSSKGAGVLLFLMIGNVCNGLVNMPYAMQLAFGWTRLVLCFNIVSIFILIPAVFWGAQKYGAIGGAAAWASLNLSYLLLLPHLMHEKILHNEKKTWYLTSVVLPGAVCAVIFFVFRQVPLSDFSRWGLFAAFLSCWFFSTLVTMAAMPALRRYAINWWVHGRRS